MKENKTQAHEALFIKAVQAGEAAAKASMPTPVTFRDADLFDRPLPGGNTYYTTEGLCGFAKVTIRGNTSFARWAKKANVFRKSYEGGLYYWVDADTQSVERKEAFARAMASVLSENGVTAYYESRLD